MRTILTAHGITVFALASSMLAASTGCDRITHAEARRHMARATALYAENKYREAAAEYDSVLRLSPGNDMARRQLGLARYYQGDAAGAYPLLLQVRQDLPADDGVGVALGFLELERGDTDRARVAAEAAIRRAPRFLEAYRLLGTVRLTQGAPAPAEAAFRMIERIAPRERQGHHLVGLALLKQGKHTDAAQEFEAALQLSPGYVEPLARLVEIALAEGRRDDALARVRRQLALPSHSGGQEELLGVLLLARGDRAGAEAAFRSALVMEPQLNTARIRLTELYVAAGRERDAEANLLEAVRANPGNPGPLVLLATTYEQGGNVAAAQSTYEQALKVAPRFAPAANNLAWLLSEKRGDSKQALRYAELARSSAPKEPNVADTYGWVLYREGLYQRALPLLEESAASLPGDGSVQYHLGMTYRALGREADARKALERALAVPGQFPGKDEARRALASPRT